MRACPRPRPKGVCACGLPQVSNIRLGPEPPILMGHFRMWKPLAVTVAVGLVLAGSAWKLGALDWLTDESHGALSACEEYVVSTLKAPSSYQRAWYEYKPAPPLTSAEFRNLQSAQANVCGGDQCSEAGDYMQAAVEGFNRELDRKLRDGLALDDLEQALLKNRKQMDADAAADKPAARTAFVTVEYDAQNAFGASIRSFAMCRFSAIGEDGRFSKTDILSAGPIDGESGRLVKEMSGPAE